jgi:hypothetical protein
MAHRKQFFVREDEDFKWVLSLAKLNVKECCKAYKGLIKDVFIEPTFHEDYRRAVEEYMRWSKARIYRTVARDHLLREGRADNGHEIALKRVCVASEALREHAVKLHGGLQEDPVRIDADIDDAQEPSAAGTPPDDGQRNQPSIRITVDDIDAILASARAEAVEDLKRSLNALCQGKPRKAGFVKALTHAAESEPSLIAHVEEMTKWVEEENKAGCFVKCVPLRTVLLPEGPSQLIKEFYDEGMGPVVNHVCCAAAIWVVFKFRQTIDPNLASRLRKNLLPTRNQTLNDMMELRVPMSFRASQSVVDVKDPASNIAVYLSVLAETRRLLQSRVRLIPNVRYLLEHEVAPFVLNGLCAQITFQGCNTWKPISIPLTPDGSHLATKALSAFYAVLARRYGKMQVKQASTCLFGIAFATIWSMVREGTVLIKDEKMSQFSGEIDPRVNEGTLWMVIGALLKTNEMVKKGDGLRKLLSAKEPSEFKAQVLAMVKAFE